MSNEPSPSVVVATSTEPTANSTAQPPAPVSIIVPCCGQLEYTRYCLFSLLRHSRAPFEVICLDISSLDGTTEYLTGIATAAPVPVNILRAEAASDFKAACDQALAAARGEFVVWLNNDTIVPQRWLQHLVALASTHPQIGMVGPMANYGPPTQRVDEVPYRLGAKVKRPATFSHKVLADDIAAVNQFAAEWREKNKGQSTGGRSPRRLLPADQERSAKTSRTA